MYSGSSVMVEVRKLSLFIAFQAALSDELVICSSISCYLFLYVRSFIGSEEKNTHHEKDVRYKQQYNIKLSYFIRRDSSHFHADALSSIEGLQCLSCGEEGNKS